MNATTTKLVIAVVTFVAGVELLPWLIALLGPALGPLIGFALAVLFGAAAGLINAMLQKPPHKDQEQ